MNNTYSLSSIARTFMSVVIFSLVVVSHTGCSNAMRIKPGEIPQAHQVTVKDKQVAESFVQQYISHEGDRELPPGQYSIRVKKIVDRLGRAAGFSGNSFPIHIVDAKDEANAMVVSGASVVVYKKLMDKVKSDDELAVVLAHEMGHVLAGHNNEAEEQKKKARAVSIGSSILGAITSVAMSAAGYSGASDLAGSVAESGTRMIGYGAVVGAFDRRQEYEADHVGLMLMAKAGYDPHIAVSFWSRSKEIFGAGSTKAGAFFSTHPATSDRLSAIEKAMPMAMQYYAGTEKGQKGGVKAKTPPKSSSNKA